VASPIRPATPATGPQVRGRSPRYSTPESVICMCLCALLWPMNETVRTQEAAPSFSVPADIHAIGIMMFDYRAYYFTAGGIHEYSDSLTALGKAEISRCLCSALVAKGYSASLLERDTMDTAAMNTELLYSTVQTAIEYHVYGAARFPARVARFDYTIGPIDGICSRYGVDAIMYVDGFDEMRTPLRKRMAIGAMVGHVAGAVVAAFIGVGGGGVVLRDDCCLLKAALVTRDGSICWYGSNIESGESDPTDHTDAESVVEDLVSSLHGTGAR